MKFFSIETNQILLDGGSLFGSAPKALWQKWMVPDSQNRLKVACRVLLVQTNDGRNILFEAGLGPFFDPKMRERYGIGMESELLKNLQAVGVKEEEVDAVILSHLHFDHAGGLLSAYDEGPSRLLFPKAKYYVSKEHWAVATTPHTREKGSFIPHLHDLLKASKRLVFIDGARHPDFDFVTFQLSHGHTVGLLLSEFQHALGPLVYASDLIPGMPWMHLPITTGYDRFAELLVDEKTALLSRLFKVNGALFFVHDLDTVCAKISVDERGRYVGSPIAISF